MSQNQDSSQQQQQQSFLPEAASPTAHHYHDAFGDGDTGVDYGDPLDFEEGDYDSVDGDAPTDVTDKAQPEVQVDTNAHRTTIDATTVDELREEVGLHETTLSTLHQKLTTIAVEIEAEEAHARKLRDELQMLNQKKIILRKKTEQHNELVKRVSGTLEKTLGRLRGVVGREQEGVAESHGEKGGLSVENESELIDEETVSQIDSPLPSPNHNESEPAANVDVPNSKTIEIPLRHVNKHIIQWPVLNVANRSKEAAPHPPSWRTNLPTTPILWNIDSPDLLTQLMNISSLENLLERQYLIREGKLPDNSGWINENCIVGTCLDIYRHLDWKRFNSINDPQTPAETMTNVSVAEQQSGLDPNAILCPYELGGVCADDRCLYQHLGRRSSPTSIYLEDGRRYLRYYELPEVRLSEIFGGHGFMGREIGSDDNDERQILKSELDAFTDQSTKDHNSRNQADSSKRVYPCPTCAKISLNTQQLRCHMKECNPTLLVVDGTEYSVQNVLVDDAKIAEPKSLEENFVVGDTSDFTNNNDLVCLPTIAQDSDSDSSDDSVMEESNPTRKGLALEDKYWWQGFVPSVNKECPFGFQRVCDSLDALDEHHTDIIRCSTVEFEGDGSAELQDVIMNARIIDFCQICIYTGQDSLGLSMLQNLSRPKERDESPPLLQYAIEPMKHISFSRSACDIFSCQVNLMLISEFFRLRYLWLSRKRPKREEGPRLDEFITLFNRDAVASSDDHDIKRYLSLRIPSGTDDSDQSSWEDFVSCLQLQLEKHITVPYSYKMTEKEQLSFMLECSLIGQILQELVESITDHNFSPMSHVLEPTWAVIQQLLKTSQRELASNRDNTSMPHLVAVLVVGPIIFTCTSKIIMNHVGSARPFSALPELESRRRLDLSALDKFINEMTKAIRRYGRRKGKLGNVEGLLAPLYTISVAICVTLGSFDKAQLRLENAMKSRLTNEVSEMLLSQLIHLRMNCPSYGQISELESLSPDNMNPAHTEIALMALSSGITLRGLDACGDRVMLTAAVDNPSDHQEWQNLVSHAVAKYPAKPSETVSIKNLEFAVSHPTYELNQTNIPEYPRSLFVAGQWMKHLSLVGCMLDRLPHSFGIHLRGLVSLNLSQNRLVEVPPCIGALSFLQTLDVSHNNLTSIAKVIRSCLNLQFLDASYNQLSTFPGDLALHLPLLQSFVMEGNPACDQAFDESRSPKRCKVDNYR